MRNPTVRWIGFKYSNDRLAELRRGDEYLRATMAPLTHSERVALQCKFTWPYIDHSECCEDG